MRGSYLNGFAPRDGQPLYPELWRGCVGAWAPCLGPTGLTLRDWSGNGRHGTLTNMDPGTDWVPSGGDYCLDFDGTNDYVSLGTSASFSPSPMSIAFWLKMNATPVASDGVLGRMSTASWNDGYGVYWSSASVIRFWIGLYSYRYGQISVASPTSWNHIVCEWVAGTSPEIYLDGVKGTNNSQTFTTQTATSTELTIGRTFSDSYNINGQIDDLRIYNRVLSAREKSNLGSRRGIAYELAPRRRSSVQVSAAFNRRRRLLIGASS